MRTASALSIYLNQNDNATQNGLILTENKWDKQINSPSMRYEKKMPCTERMKTKSNASNNFFSNVTKNNRAVTLGNTR